MSNRIPVEWLQVLKRLYIHVADSYLHIVCQELPTVLPQASAHNLLRHGSNPLQLFTPMLPLSLLIHPEQGFTVPSCCVI